MISELKKELCVARRSFRMAFWFTAKNTSPKPIAWFSRTHTPDNLWTSDSWCPESGPWTILKAKKYCCDFLRTREQRLSIFLATSSSENNNHLMLKKSKKQQQQHNLPLELRCQRVILHFVSIKKLRWSPLLMLFGRTMTVFTLPYSKQRIQDSKLYHWQFSKSI